MHDTGDVRRRRTSSLVDTEAEMSASTSARDRDSGIRTTLSATILAPRGRRPRGNLCMAAGSRLVWRVEHLAGVESVRPRFRPPDHGFERPRTERKLVCGLGSRLVSRVEHLAEVESVRETRSSRSTDETSPRCRQTG